VSCGDLGSRRRQAAGDAAARSCRPPSRRRRAHITRRRSRTRTRLAARAHAKRGRAAQKPKKTKKSVYVECRTYTIHVYYILIKQACVLLGADTGRHGAIALRAIGIADVSSSSPRKRIVVWGVQGRKIQLRGGVYFVLYVFVFVFCIVFVFLAPATRDRCGGRKRDGASCLGCTLGTWHLAICSMSNSIYLSSIM
jgi:hypothetical protein